MGLYKKGELAAVGCNFNAKRRKIEGGMKGPLHVRVPGPYHSKGNTKNLLHILATDCKIYFQRALLPGSNVLQCVAAMTHKTNLCSSRLPQWPGDNPQSFF